MPWFDLSNSESPQFAGRAVVELASHPEVMKRTGSVVVIAQLARDYGFADIDRKEPRPLCRVLYCFFIIEHGRRKILHFNVTDHPTGPWIVQQLREAFPESCPYRYAILDRYAKYGKDVMELLLSSGNPSRQSS
jgi:hypothetical protein